MIPANPEIEARTLVDRRQHATPMLSHYFLRGRRLSARRNDEAVNIYVDRYRFAEWAQIIALFIMAIIDWLWTLRHFSRGMEESNPLMAWAAAAGGIAGFSITKLLISVICCSFLMLHSRFRYTRILLPFALAAYAYVMVIHVIAENA